MAIHKLSPAALNRKKPGLYFDGGGLALQISIAKDGGRNRSWLFRYAVPDATKPSGYRAREMGLGSCNTISLQEARDLALACRKQRLAGVDPIEHRNAERAGKVAAAVRVLTFDQCANAYMASHRAAWRSHEHAAQWVSSLVKKASPIIGKLPVSEIDTALVMKVLQPMWTTTPESASRLRARIEAILSWATTAGYRAGDNPARWRDHLENLLPSRRKLQPGKRHAALAFAELPALMAELRGRDGTAERALEFLVLVAARTNEVLGAKWSEVDLKERLWIVPGERMKGGRAHRVPLPDRAVAIVAEMARYRRGDFVFPGARGEVLSPHTLARVLKRMNRGDVTTHGFRSTFRDWAAERTAYPNHVAEMALAHSIGSAVEASYRRGDLLEKRRALMQAWSAYCGKPAPSAAAVVPLRASPQR